MLNRETYNYFNDLIDAIFDIYKQYEGKILFGVQSLIFKSGLFVLETDLRFSGPYPFSVNVTFGHNEGAGCPCVDFMDLKQTIHEFMKRYHIKRNDQLSLFDFTN